MQHSDTGKDTYQETRVASGLPFQVPTVGAPDDRGFSAPSADLAVGPIVVSGDGSVTTRYAENTGMGGVVSPGQPSETP